jgi:protein-tyrosine phosphatase
MMQHVGRTSLYDSYVGLTRSSGDAIRQIFESLAEPGALPAIFFCAAGKDRTGIVAALVLSALLVEDEDVVDDYCRTEAVSPEALGQGYAERLATLPREFCEAPAHAMRAFLEAIHREFGSTRAFLAMIGIDKTLLRRLERALLVDE